MSPPPLRSLVVTLGRELVSRGLHSQAATMRIYLFALDRGLLNRKNELETRATPDFVYDWLGLLQIPTREDMFPVHASDTPGCPKCHEHATILQVSVLDRAQHVCSKCKYRWLTIYGRVTKPDAGPVLRAGGGGRSASQHREPRCRGAEDLAAWRLSPMRPQRACSSTIANTFARSSASRTRRDATGAGEARDARSTSRRRPTRLLRSFHFGGDALMLDPRGAQRDE